MRLSKPVYESIPVLYASIGGAAIAIAYFEPMRVKSIVAFGLGIIATVAGLTVFLHRKDHRALRCDYSGQAIDLPSSFDR